MNKYGNKKTTVDCITFDSKMESDYYLYLKENMDNLNIIDIELQPSFILIPSYKKNGKTIRSGSYKADFKITYENGNIDIVDVKGMTTELFNFKKKLFEYKYPEYTLTLITWYKKRWMTIDKKNEIKKIKKMESDI